MCFKIKRCQKACSSEHTPCPGIPRFKRVKGLTIISRLIKYYHGQLSALHMPCSKFARQTEALSPHQEANGSPLEDHTGQAVIKKQRAVAVQGCVLQMWISFVAAHWWGCPRDFHFTLSQGCWHLESNFPKRKKKKGNKIFYLKEFICFFVWKCVCAVWGSLLTCSTSNNSSWKLENDLKLDIFNGSLWLTIRSKAWSEDLLTLFVTITPIIQLCILCCRLEAK